VHWFFAFQIFNRATFTKVYRAKEQAGTKSEIRISKSETNRGQNEFKTRKSKTPNPIPPVWNIVFVLYFLFEFVSNFGFRVSNL